MELFLNILWLLLALPALWVWRYETRAARTNAFARLGPLLILGCVLVLLFPVISATDDLQAMRFEMEDPGCQGWVKNWTGDRSSCPLSKPSSLLVQSSGSACAPQDDRVCGRVYLAPPSAAVEASLYQLVSRAPPAPRLG